MVKGTPSMGKFHTPTHGRCRRCAHCGFGSTKTWRKYRWLKSLKERM
ncbi:MAG: 50S ribosomal protein L37e [Aigarchaeota archaeon]|nr:50S ribosomal protein L37e [Candidatus Pelearchaeum maunauluense]